MDGKRGEGGEEGEAKATMGVESGVSERAGEFAGPRERGRARARHVGVSLVMNRT